ncbi:MAG: hypothetical protein IKH26_11160 [Bacteroidaceae bacterium]|nr:hypothetical protein [Bacteroidaceae bacterium]
MAGLDQLRIEFPIYDEEDYDGFIDDGYIYVTPTGGREAFTRLKPIIVLAAS